MGKTEHRISYKAGVTRTPSDFLCEEGELAECVNMTTDHEELKVIPSLEASSVQPSGKLLFIHRHGDVKSYFLVRSGNIEWWDGVSVTGTIVTTHAAGTEISSVGNTVIISKPSAGLLYLKWKDGSYEVLGSGIPELKVEFSLGDGALWNDGAEHFIQLPGIEGENYKQVGDSTVVGSKFRSGQYETAKEALISLVSLRLSEVRKSKRFSFPFWARAAVRLYDGRYIYISNPVLLMPTVMNNWNIFTCDDDGNLRWGRGDDEKPGGWNQTNYKPYACKLKYKVIVPYGFTPGAWEDIIGGIDIFVSEEVRTFDTEGKWTIENPYIKNIDDSIVFNPYFDGLHALYDWCNPRFYKDCIPEYSDADIHTWAVYFCPEPLSEYDITKRLVDASRFYKIVEHDLGEIVGGTLYDASDRMDKSALSTLTSRPFLKEDDYFSRSSIYAKVLYSYNGRLHAGNVERGMFSGFSHFSYTQYYVTPLTFDYYTYIRTESGDRIVMSVSNGLSELVDVWFYYPDRRAYKTEVYMHGGNLHVATLSLTEHPLLNGAYYFGRLPQTQDSSPSTVTKTAPTPNTSNELLRDQLIVSEANNPFLFHASGYVTVGMGDIIGLASNTVALGQEEHGIHPLLVFSSRGISALHLKDDGTYLRSDVIPREVCVNAKSITETDDAVYFVSKKGLMVIVGTKVRCVSELMNGKAFNTQTVSGLTLTDLESDVNSAPWAQLVYLSGGSSTFQDFLQYDGLRIGYDYMDSRLLLFNGTKDYCWVYSMEDGTFTKQLLPGKVDNVVNDYPDHLVQRTTNQLYTLYGKTREENVSSRTKGFLLTRPLKLSGPLTVSSLRELKNVGVWDKTNSKVKTEIYVSDDLSTWYRLSSRFGAAVKYFRIAIFTDMLPVERLSGTILRDQERRSENMR